MICCRINRKSLITIQIWFTLTKFWMNGKVFTFKMLLHLESISNERKSVFTIQIWSSWKIFRIYFCAVRRNRQLGMTGMALSILLAVLGRLRQPQDSWLVCWEGRRALFVFCPEIRLYLPLSDWFGTKWKSVWFQINRKMVNTIWF